MRKDAPWLKRNGPALVLFAVVFGGIYLYATREYQRLPKVKREAGPTSVIVTPDQPADIGWPRREEPPAPALSLHVPITAAGGVFGDKGGLGRLDGKSDHLHLHAALPDPEALSVAAFGSWCPHGPLAADCPVAELSITVQQDAPERSEPGALVMETRARGASDAATSGPIRRLNAFWVRHVRETGRLEFVGWDCDGEPPTGTTSTDLSRPLLERNRCFEPSDPQERAAPRRHGYALGLLLTACAGNGRQCTLHFGYRGRYVTVAPRTPIDYESEQANGHLFLASWEFLNRLRGDAVKPPTAERLLARAKAALANCRAIEAAGGGPDDFRRASNPEVRQHAQWQCAYAVQTAFAARKERPAEALSVFNEAMGERSPVHYEHATAMRKAFVDSIVASGQKDSEAMALAQLGIAEQMRGGQPGSADLAAKRAAYEVALRTADASLPPASPTHLAILRAYNQTFYNTDSDHPLQLPVVERWRTMLLKARGAGHPDLEPPTFTRCVLLSHMRRTAELGPCADEYAPLWARRAGLETGERYSSETNGRGLELMRWYWQYALAEDRAAEAMPKLRALGATIQPRSHPEAWLQTGAAALKNVEARLATKGRSR